ncbi:MAG: hypothetical protein CM15mP85_04760 [Rhodobacterales bacterium]|nr:MAG: hypothetical protein CM15mP85_04760 [Rhodobacterales bacterium]
MNAPAEQIDKDIFENEISDASHPEEDQENEVDPRESSEFALKNDKCREVYE